MNAEAITTTGELHIALADTPLPGPDDLHAPDRQAALPKLAPSQLDLIRSWIDRGARRIALELPSPEVPDAATSPMWIYISGYRDTAGALMLALSTGVITEQQYTAAVDAIVAEGNARDAEIAKALAGYYPAPPLSDVELATVERFGLDAEPMRTRHAVQTEAR